MSTLSKANRIIIKIGSSLLVEKKTGKINKEWLISFAEDIYKLQSDGKQILIVSSGAIALGKKYLGINKDKLKLEESQAAAAAGQSRLLYAYQECLAEHNISIAQVLLTIDDTEERRKYLNARNTIETLINLSVIPIINENDTVATSEIKFGDNDRLSAKVAVMTSADYLILLSDVDGLYTADPMIDSKSTFISEVLDINNEIEDMGGDTIGNYGKGGMATKISAAKISTKAGCSTIIAKGSIKLPITSILKGGKATWFKALSTPKKAKKKWIASNLKSLGSITIDEGAKKALLVGKSLLPAGVIQINSNFNRGDPVNVLDKSGNIIAKGLISYSSEDAKIICGFKSNEIETILGYAGRDEMIHRDELALMIN
ncbi:glutamate 5-kinase [Alphaproteobacteria bacterium]|nr:glutamate 5-kinase [Alphaproteobacteria bacterium]